MKHIVRFEAGYDCTRFECKFDHETCIPDSDGTHGRHGLSIRFVSQGENGAAQFLLYTGWLPQHAQKSMSMIGARNIDTWGDSVMPYDLGYHSKTPRYDDHTPYESCEFCDGQTCYYDGSALNATDAMYALVNGGEDALWAFLDSYYVSVFEGGLYPDPAEYPKPVRKN